MSSAAPPSRATSAPHVAHLLRLQRSAGNAAVARMAERLRPPPRRRVARYADPGVQSVYDANKDKATDDQKSALDLLDLSYGNISGPWSKLDWTKISKSAADRVFHPEHVQQNPLGLCGPAAVLNYMATATPGTFTYMVESIFEDGKLGSKKINDTLLGSDPHPSMDPMDWMMLSAMQDLANSVLNYYGRETKWRDGESIGDLQSTMTSFTKIAKTTEYSCGYWGVKDQTMKVNELLRKHGNDICVVMEVDSKTLQNETARGSNDHFIRLLKPVDWGSDKVKFDVFTWGSNRSLSFDVKNYEHMVDGYVVGGVSGVDL